MPQPPDGSASVALSVEGFVPGAAVTVSQTAQGNAVGPQPATRLSSLVDTVAGFPVGSRVRITQSTPAFVEDFRMVRVADSTLTQLTWDSPLDPAFVLAQPIKFDAFHRSERLLQAVDPSSQRLTWSLPLIPEFNVSQPIDFDTGASASFGDFLDANEKATLRIEAKSPGGWGNQIQVRVSHSSLAATRTSSDHQPVGGAGSLVQSIVGFPVGSLVKVFQDHSPSPLVTYRLVAAVDPSGPLLVWNTPLDAAYDLTKAISFETLEFGLSVYLKGQIQEVISNLSLVEMHPRYVTNAITDQSSQLIRVTDLKSSSGFPERLPSPGAWNLTRGLLNLESGRDGIAALQAMDFTGDPGSESKWGIRTLEDVDDVAIVAVPDVLIQPVPPVAYAPQPPSAPNPCLPTTLPPPVAMAPPPPIVESAPTFSLRDIFRVQQTLVDHCESMMNRIALLDPPIFSNKSQSIDLAEIQSWRARFDSKYAALYYPWVLVYDPLRLANEVVRAIPPSGHVAGVFARTDLQIGVHKAPANAELMWAQDVVTSVDAAAQGVLNPIGVNCIRVFPGRGLLVYGARTVSSDPDWRFVNVRRLMMMIETAVQYSIQWAVFEPNNFYLRQTIAVAISSFLEVLWQRGALVGAAASQAYYVKCDEQNNPAPLADVGELIVEVGVAPVQPAEFVVFRIGRTGNTLEVTE
jgi:hypothetical protein